MYEVISMERIRVAIAPNGMSEDPSSMMVPWLGTFNHRTRGSSSHSPITHLLNIGVPIVLPVLNKIFR